jgi:L-lactate dehydrogenase complex protein LldF
VSNTFVGMPGFPEAAKVALADTQLRRNLAHATSKLCIQPLTWYFAVR